MRSPAELQTETKRTHPSHPIESAVPLAGCVNSCRVRDTTDSVALPAAAAPGGLDWQEVELD